MRKDCEYKKLGEVANVVMGQSPDGSNVNNENGMEFHQGKINFGEQFLMKSDCFTTQVTKVAEKGSILLCVRAPIGIINITDRDICIGRGLCAIKEKTEVDNLFLYYYLLNKKLYFEKNSTGSTFKAISSKVVLNTPIFLPPKPTQLAIVAELDKLNEMTLLKKQQLKDYDQLAQSIFYEMFGDPVENEKGWEVKRLGDISEFKNGLNFSKSDTGFSYKFLGVSDFQDKHIIHSSDLSNIHLSDKISEDYHLKKGDIVFVRSNGSKELVGRNVLLNISEPTTFSGFCIRCRLVDCRTNIVYLSYLLKSATIRPLITNNGRGCNISNVNQKILSMLSVPLPPLPLQQQFAARIEAIERQKQQVSETIKDLETLLASRMQYWFD